jgi:hypothetical protein
MQDDNSHKESSDSPVMSWRVVILFGLYSLSF